MIRFIVPGEPTGKGRPRFGNGRTFTPAKTKHYESDVKMFFLGSKSERYPDDAQIEMRIDAYFQMPKSASKKKKELMESGELRPTKKPDADNILKIIADALNGLAYHDDAAIVGAHVHKWYAREDEFPRVDITIWDTTEDGTYDGSRKNNGLMGRLLKGAP